MNNHLEPLKEDVSNEHFRLTWPSLESVPSAKEGNRKAYLLKYVCNQYFGQDTAFCRKFFKVD